MTNLVSLSELFRVIAVSGDDAVSFIHGQLTQDVAGLPSGEARLAGYCTAQGRLLATMVVWKDEAGLSMLVRADLAESLVRRLSMFVLRAKVKLAVAPLRVWGVTGAADAPDLPGGKRIPVPGGERRWWWLGEQDPAVEQTGTALQWRQADLAAGLPWISAATQDLFIPQTLNLDLLGGVSFTKGCYPGQEVVARSHYRGTIKRRMVYGQAESTARPGADVYATAQPDEPVGRVIDAAGDALLFACPVDLPPGADLRLDAPDGPRITHSRQITSPPPR